MIDKSLVRKGNREKDLLDNKLPDYPLDEVEYRGENKRRKEHTRNKLF